MIVKEEYGNIPWFISENGMVWKTKVASLEKMESSMMYRIEFYEEHLTWLHKRIEEGSNCFGYHTWTAFDCWS